MILPAWLTYRLIPKSENLVTAFILIFTVFVLSGCTTPKSTTTNTSNKVDQNTADETVNTNDDNDIVQQSKEIQECKKGVILESFAGKVSISGKESAKIGGQNLELCCLLAVENSSDTEGQSGKVCYVIDQPESIVTFEKKDNSNNFYLFAASVKVDNQRCTYSYDEEGKEELVGCYPISK